MSTPTVEKDIYFIRHGLSTQNNKRTFHGGDVPLAELGRRQAKFVAKRLEDIDAEVILTSPMERALHTAQAIQEKTNLPLEETQLLREFVPPSALLGKSRDCDEGQAYLKDLYAHIDDPDWHHSDEENYHDMHRRALLLLDYLIARPESRIIAVSHAGFMRIVFTAMMMEGVADAKVTKQLMHFLRPMNTGVTIVHYKPDEKLSDWRLVTWNDHAHLAETDLEEPKDYAL